MYKAVQLLFTTIYNYFNYFNYLDLLEENQNVVSGSNMEFVFYE